MNQPLFSSAALTPSLLVCALVLGAPTLAHAQGRPAPREAVVLIAATGHDEALADRIEERAATILAERLGATPVTTATLLPRTRFASRAGLGECALNDVCRQDLSALTHDAVTMIGQLRPGHGPIELSFTVDVAGGSPPVTHTLVAPTASLLLARLDQTLADLDLSPRPPDVASPDLQPLGWTGLGVGVLGLAALGAAGHFRWQYERHLDDLDALTQTPQPPGQRSYIEGLRRDLDRSAAATDLFLAVGIGTLSVGAALLVWDLWPEESPPPASLSLTPFADGGRLDLGVPF